MRSFLLIVFLSLMSSYSLAQDNSVPLLSLKISLLEMSIKENYLSVQAEVTNNDTKAMVIDKNSIWYKVSFIKSYGFFSTIGEVGPVYQGQYLVLKPNQSFKNTRRVKLDKDFFNTFGEYRMTLMYGQFRDAQYEGLDVWNGNIKSNELTFEYSTKKVKKRK